MRSGLWDAKQELGREMSHVQDRSMAFFSEKSVHNPWESNNNIIKLAFFMHWLKIQVLLEHSKDLHL